MSGSGTDLPSRKLPNALRCVGCDYDLSGLDPLGVCPECGVGIDASLRAHLGGTAWQRNPGYRTWTETAWLLTREPSAVVQVNCRRPRPRTLLWNTLICAFCATPHAFWVLLIAYSSLPVLGAIVLIALAFFGMNKFFRWVQWVGSGERPTPQIRLPREIVGHILFPLVLSVGASAAIFSSAVMIVMLCERFGITRGSAVLGALDVLLVLGGIALLLPVWGIRRSLLVRKAARAHGW
ncbi:MAG: hypothetical protein ACTS3F_14755 [Phycisphaerales bacterium]